VVTAVAGPERLLANMGLAVTMAIVAVVLYRGNM
jgi:hypothetical protein